jgi:dephospho-CoA kinase
VFKVGLTGGIGCGKTTVSRLFAELDVPVIDADSIAHQLVEPEQPALIKLGEVFGNHIINSDGSLHRAQLREIVFSDSSQKQQLEAILHPLVFAEIQTITATLSYPYCIISIPLLFETQRTQFVDRILVIDCPEKIQIERVKRRDGLDEAQIQSIINTQVSREFRLTHADDVIDNTQTTGNELAEQVKKLHNQYLSSASLV